MLAISISCVYVLNVFAELTPADKREIKQLVAEGVRSVFEGLFNETSSKSGSISLYLNDAYDDWSERIVMFNDDDSNSSTLMKLHSLEQMDRTSPLMSGDYIPDITNVIYSINQNNLSAVMSVSGFLPMPLRILIMSSKKQAQSMLIITFKFVSHLEFKAIPSLKRYIIFPLTIAGQKLQANFLHKLRSFKLRSLIQLRKAKTTRIIIEALLFQTCASPGI